MMGSQQEDDFCPELPPHLLKKKDQVSEEDFCPELPPHLQAKINYPSVDSLNSNSNEVADEDMCPALPPNMQSTDFGKDVFSTKLSSGHLKLSKKSSKKSCKETQSLDQDLKDQTDDFCPELPPHLLKTNSTDVFCPKLPPDLQKSNPHFSKETNLQHKTDKKCVTKPKLENCETLVQRHVLDCEDDPETDDESDQFCPALPPHLTSKSPRLLGPTFPPEGYQPSIFHLDEDSEEEYGPVVGPLPATEPVDMDRYIEETIAKRTKSAAEKARAASDLTPARESWMLELPEDKPLFAGLGLQARQFARKAKTDRGDTSIWTDTPADKERKAQRAAERAAAGVKEPITSKSSPAAPGPEDIAARKRDEKLQEIVDQHNAKKRPAPLVETHKAKKKCEETSVTGVGRERKPFSREEDLHVNKFDEAQKSTILKKARQLNDRFASGKAAKYL